MDSLKEALTMQHLIANLERAARDETHSIMGMLELVAEGPLTESQQEQLRSCGSSADRLLRTVQNVYEFACPETAKPQMSEIDLQELVADTAGLVRELAWHKGLSFTARIRSGTPARVTGDRHSIENILIRLIDNAIKFTDEGWIRLIVARRKDDPATGRIEFIICDSGRGIPEETIVRVMDPAASDHLADGLGLPIVHQLVLGMGGELSIIRRDGGGTQVTVSLPLKISDACVDRALSEVNLTRDHSMESLRPLKILVAEDSDQSYYVIESYLEGQAHQLARAQNGADALDMFKLDRYDLVFMDVHMPVMDGYAATRAIREWETTDGRARVPIVVLSTDSLETQRQNGARAGCSGYITKPASKAAVLSSLQRFTRAGIQD